MEGYHTFLIFNLSPRSSNPVPHAKVLMAQVIAANYGRRVRYSVNSHNSRVNDPVLMIEVLIYQI
jgi:hypothetical protein